MSTVYRYLAALYAARQVPQYLKQCQSIVAKIGENPIFASAPLSQAQLTTNLEALAAAEVDAHQGLPGAAAVRNAKLMIVRSDMRQLKGYVQGVADANLADAMVIIESAGMSVAKKGVRTKSALTARHGKVPTTSLLYAKADKKKRVSYQWQRSVDQVTWIDLAATVHASTLVTGLTPATIYYFRFRTLTSAGLSEWSAAVSFIAH